jgi:hypothetical protein
MGIRGVRISQGFVRDVAIRVKAVRAQQPIGKRSHNRLHAFYTAAPFAEALGRLTRAAGV